MESIKWLHITCALLSGSGFFIRGILMMRGSAWLQARMVKIVPHVVDTVLLVSAIALVFQWDWAALPWLLAKTVALFVYIGLGMVALRSGRNKRARVLAWLAALLVFAYIMAVAVNKNPLVFF